MEMSLKRRMKRGDTICVFDPKIHMNLTEKETKQLDKLEQYENMDWFVSADTYGEGRSFGEKNLMDHKTRQATI